MLLTLNHDVWLLCGGSGKFRIHSQLATRSVFRQSWKNTLQMMSKAYFKFQVSAKPDQLQGNRTKEQPGVIQYTMQEVMQHALCCHVINILY